MRINKETIKLPLQIWVVFLIIAVLFFKIKNSMFFLFNFIYIGTSVAMGIFLSEALPQEKKSWGRRVTQFLVGIYMLIFLGIIGKENMQIEGFFMLLLGGAFAGAVIHYLVAKIFGVLIFNRAWCGYACWTAMILDFLPYKIPQEKRIKKIGIFRYVHFFLSLILVLYFYKIGKEVGLNDKEGNLLWLAIGNLFYYLIGIILAFYLKDNRAFCKYVCPIPVFQKILSRFSLLKVEIDKNSCIDCKLCEKNCPMNIKLLTYKEKNERVLSTECILCGSCIKICPKNAVKFSKKFDFGFNEELEFKE